MDQMKRTLGLCCGKFKEGLQQLSDSIQDKDDENNSNNNRPEQPVRDSAPATAAATTTPKPKRSTNQPASKSNLPPSSSNTNPKPKGGGLRKPSSPRETNKTKLSSNNVKPTTTTAQGTESAVDSSKWKLSEHTFGGTVSYESIGKEEQIKGKSISTAIAHFRKHPETYVAIKYQTSMIDWPVSDQQYALIHRKGTQNFQPTGVSPKGWMTILLQNYQVLPPFPSNSLPNKYRDKYTDHMTFQGKKLHGPQNPPLLPGRGMGVADTHLLKIIGDVDPSDVSQGRVGDCWLLSAISALAEFDGAVKKLFRKTKHLYQMPKDTKGVGNMYTITLYDLATWKEVDIVIDERLCAAPRTNQNERHQLLASQPSEDGELWVCYLEKALAIHCGGWDKITGGQCTHGWALLTGCKEQYMIKQNPKNGKFGCFAKYHPVNQKWARHANAPREGEQGMWEVPWPRVGGGGTGEISEDQLFLKLVAWDQENYIVGASTKGVSDKHSTGGLVDNHAYSVIESHSNVCGTGIDLLKVRNPWGKGEIEDGEFDDDGPGWDRYPQIKKKLNPVVADDGIFWVTKQEFFHFYQTIYLSASNMTEFLED